MKKVIAAGIAAAGIAGGSVAVAAIAPFGSALAQDSGSTTTTTPPSDTQPSPRHSVFDDALKSLVDDGTLTQDQADKVKSRVQEKAQAARAANPLPRFKPGIGVGESLDKIASVLGISVDDLKTQLRSGKTLGEIAGDKKPALITALTDAANARIDEAVKNGKLTDAQAAELKSKTADRITKLVDEGFKLGFRRPR
jgi:ribosomal protein S20